MKKEHVLVVLLVWLIAGVGVAQQQGTRGDKGPRDRGMGPLMEIADLTEQQKEAIKKIHLENLKATQSLRNEMGEKEARLQTLRSDNSATKNDLLALASEIGDLRKELYLARVEKQFDVRALLTEDQKVMFDNMKRHRHRGKQRKSHLK